MPVAFVASSHSFRESTFLQRELERLHDEGIWPILFTLKTPEADDLTSEEFRRFKGRVYHTPFLLSGPVLRSQWRCILAHPRTYFTTLGRLLVRSIKKPRIVLQSLAIFPKSVHYGEVARAWGCQRVHGLWATASATGAFIASRTAGLDFSFTGHAWDIFGEQTLLDLKITEADLVLTCTNFNRQHLITEYSGENPDKIRLNYHGLSLGDFSAVPPRDAAVTFFLSVGRKVRKKGYGVLVEAARILKQRRVPFRCEIVGESVDRAFVAELQRSVKDFDLSDHVRLIEHLPSAEVKERMRQCSVLVQPSLVDTGSMQDGIPNVLIEAMALGRPVISTTISGIPELVTSGDNGILVPPQEPEALADAMERLAQDAGQRRALALAGRRRVEEMFDLDRTIKSLASALRVHRGGTMHAGQDDTMKR